MMLGNRIKALRQEDKHTQRNLAQKLNIGYSTLAMYETGKRDPDTETLARIAAFFHVSTDYLLGLSNVRTIQEQNQTLSKDEMTLLHYYRKMQDHQKDIVRKVAETISPEENGLDPSVVGK